MSKDYRGNRHTFGRQNYEGFVTGFVAPEFKRSNGPRINLRRVKCMECEAEVDQPCISLITGKVKSAVHASRQRIATRRFNEERGL